MKLELPNAVATGENPHGPQILPEGRVRFRLWAPACPLIMLELSGHTEPLPLTPLPEGWHELIAEASPGARYRFLLPDGRAVPDPASRFQPEDVHGPSEIVDPAAWGWHDTEWRGRAWEEAVIYELHLGAFTPEGTFQAAIGKLDHLISLGVTALELMPVADFPGHRNWGYDGVLLYAPDSSYGRPEDLHALVDAAHAKGLMVLLDVVYNHFGPDGNYTSLYAPQFLTDHHKTPWGNAVNYDGDGSRAVRDFVLHNALYWIRDFHMDGLRLDAVHAIVDDSRPHILDELAASVRAAAGHRRVHLLLENEENQASRLQRDNALQPKLYTAQWNDDVHHVLHTAATGEASGYYAAYAGDTRKLGRALAEGFAYQGEHMTYRGKPRGESSGHLPPSAFVAFLQNHDQVGNRAFGDRVGHGVSPQVLRAVAAVYLLLPQIPMLFMGEEWNAAQPFPFFCDLGPSLADAVRQGRRDEFARFPEFSDPEKRERIPDPTADSTFLSAKLNWDDLAQPGHAEWLTWYRNVLAARRRTIVPLLGAISRGGEFLVIGEGAVRVRWQLRPSGSLVLSANLSGNPVRGFPPAAGIPIWQEGGIDSTSGVLQPWSVLWSRAEEHTR
jgi:malto-oligosyltrehalose trehalohydrolase